MPSFPGVTSLLPKWVNKLPAGNMILGGHEVAAPDAPAARDPGGARIGWEYPRTGSGFAGAIGWPTAFR